MKKYFFNFIIFVFVFIFAFFAGYFFKQKNQKTTIITETKTEYKTIKVPVTVEELRTASLSPIKIEGKIRENKICSENYIDIIASDGYKHSEKSFVVGVSNDGNWKYAVGITAGAAAGAALYLILRK